VFDRHAPSVVGRRTIALHFSNTFSKKHSPHSAAFRQPQTGINDVSKVEWEIKMDKPWEDMTTNEKLNLLRAQIQELRTAIATSKVAEFKVKAEGLLKRDTA
jgi:hypothetical protein